MPRCQSHAVNVSASSLRRALLALLLATGLAGCILDNGGGMVPDGVVSGGITGTGTGPSTTTAANVTISGSVGDGPVTGATVTVFDVSGAVLGSMVSDSSASYRKTFSVRNSQYPLRLVVSGGTDLVTGHAPDFKMVSVMLRASDRTVNINPFSTLIVTAAMRMPGGLNGANVNRARGIVLDKLGFGLATGTVADPITSPITVSNAANIVKASEALGELVRRTRDLIAATGKSASGTGVVSALAADLVDGFVDGLGASGTDATVSAVANVVSAQVLVEAMSNNLRVNGVVATTVIDQSIRSTQAGVSNNQLSGSVRITSQMIRQAGIAVAAAQVLDNGTAVRTLGQKIAGLASNSTAGSVAAVLPAGSSAALAAAVRQVAGSSRANITQINQVVFAQGDIATPTASSGTAGSAGSTGSTSTTGTTAPASPATTGSFTVSWTAPSARSDGTALSLSAIGGYRVYYGRQRGSYPNSKNIADGTAQSATVTNLASGAYYLVMTTYDTSGLESGFSTEVLKNVP